MDCFIDDELFIKLFGYSKDDLYLNISNYKKRNLF